MRPIFHERKPPSVKVDADFEFVFRVTFGTGNDGFGSPQSVSRAWRWARQLSLGSRMAQRLTAVQAQQVFGQAIAHEIEIARQQSALDDLARDEVRQRLVGAVEASGVEVVLLRCAALCDMGLSNLQGSPTGVDVLVHASDLGKLTIALISAGCSTQLRGKGVPQPASAKGRTAVFLGDRGAAIALHRELRFLRMVPGGVFIDLACLKRCGLLLRDDVTKNKNFWIPSRAVQAADWVANALVESRFAPEYSAVSALLDAQSLGLGHDKDIAFDAYLMLQTDVEHAEFEAMRELLRKLTEGELGGLSKRAQTLLNHAIAAATVPSYRAKLKLQRRAQIWQHDGHLERTAEKVGQVLRRIKRK